MQEYEKVFFDLVRSSLWNTPVCGADSFKDWERVFRLAKQQAMLGLVAKRVLDNPELATNVSPDLRSRLKVFLMNNMATHSRLNSSLMYVVSTLKDAGVDSVLLKGQGLARNYPCPELRQCGDIDLYVGVDNYKRSYEVLKPIATEIDDELFLNIGKHFHAKIGSVFLEIHRYAEVHDSKYFNDIYQHYAIEGLNEKFNKLDFGDVVVRTPSDDFNAFYVFNHMWHHFITEGVGFRQVCDWMMLLDSHYGQLDTDYLYEILKRMRLLVPWKTFGCVLVDMLGMDSRRFPFYDARYSSRAERIGERILAEGNFGQNTSYVRARKNGYWREKLFSLWCHLSRACGVFFIFPNHAIQRAVYMLISGISAIFNDRMKKGN